MNTRKMLLAATITAAGFLSVTQAQAADTAPQTKVNYADLNLDKPSDAAKLYERLRVAAEHVCATFEGLRRHERQLHKECINQSLDAAVADVNHSGVLALHGSKGRGERLASAPAAMAPRS